MRTLSDVNSSIKYNFTNPSNNENAKLKLIFEIIREILLAKWYKINWFKVRQVLLELYDEYVSLRDAKEKNMQSFLHSLPVLENKVRTVYVDTATELTRAPKEFNKDVSKKPSRRNKNKTPKA